MSPECSCQETTTPTLNARQSYLVSHWVPSPATQGELTPPLLKPRTTFKWMALPQTSLRKQKPRQCKVLYVTWFRNLLAPVPTFSAFSPATQQVFLLPSKANSPCFQFLLTVSWMLVQWVWPLFCISLPRYSHWPIANALLTPVTYALFLHPFPQPLLCSFSLHLKTFSSSPILFPQCFPNWCPPHLPHSLLPDPDRQLFNLAAFDGRDHSLSLEDDKILPLGRAFSVSPTQALAIQNASGLDLKASLIANDLSQLLASPSACGDSRSLCAV